MKFRNPFTSPGQWCKANLHTHTTLSDGHADPAETAELYRKAGYHVLALTDHFKTADISGMGRKNFLVVRGMEFHPVCRGKTPAFPLHLVAINVPHGFGFRTNRPADANRCIRLVKEVGGETILAHPLWCGHRYDEYAYLTGYVAVEVYNATCDRVGRAYGDTDVAQLLDAGRHVGAVAVDDCHGPADRFKGWTWLKLSSLTPRAVLAALRSGCYYASTGPKIHDFRVVDGQVSVRCSPAEFIYFDAFACYGSRRVAEPGKSITRHAAGVRDGWRYVRAVVVDHRGRRAWSNPILL